MSHLASWSLRYLLCKVGIIWCLFHRIGWKLNVKCLESLGYLLITNQQIESINIL